MAWHPAGNHPSVIGWSKYRLGLPQSQWIIGSRNRWGYPPFFKGHWQPPCITLTAGNLPDVMTVQADCERVYLQWFGIWHCASHNNLAYIQLIYLWVWLTIYINGNLYATFIFEKNIPMSIPSWRSNTSWPSDTIGRHGSLSTLLDGNKPLLRPIMTCCSSDPEKHISITYYSSFHSRKCIWKTSSAKCRLFCLWRNVLRVSWDTNVYIKLDIRNQIALMIIPYTTETNKRNMEFIDKTSYTFLILKPIYGNWYYPNNAMGWEPFVHASLRNITVVWSQS